MPIPSNPDVLGAIVERLRGFPEITAFTSTPSGYISTATPAEKAVTRIATVQQATWALPKCALELGSPIGNPVTDRTGDDDAIRLDTHWWGPNEYEAMRFWRAGDPCIVPPEYLRIPADFVSQGVLFRVPQREGGPGRLQDPTTRYWYVLATYIFTYSLVAVVA